MIAVSRVFQSGNSLALRIPKQFNLVVAGSEVEMEWLGNELRIRPIKRRRLQGLSQRFTRFSADFMQDERDQEQNERPAL